MRRAHLLIAPETGETRSTIKAKKRGCSVVLGEPWARGLLGGDTARTSGEPGPSNTKTVSLKQLGREGWRQKGWGSKLGLT